MIIAVPRIMQTVTIAVIGIVIESGEDPTIRKLYPEEAMMIADRPKIAKNEGLCNTIR